MFKRILVWLPLVCSGAMLFANSAGSCTANLLRDAADEIEGNQDLDDVEDAGDFFDWLDDQFD